MMKKCALAAALVVLGLTHVDADEVADITARSGWATYPTDQSFDALVDAARAAARDVGLVVVTQAGPTGAAARRGIDIPGNRVIGVFNNDFAVRVLRLSTAAMIEAPVRVYVTENADGSATLSYKLPSTVFAPYISDAPELAVVAAELDGLFAELATIATD